MAKRALPNLDLELSSKRRRLQAGRQKHNDHGFGLCNSYKGVNSLFKKLPYQCFVLVIIILMVLFDIITFNVKISPNVHLWLELFKPLHFNKRRQKAFKLTTTEYCNAIVYRAILIGFGQHIAKFVCKNSQTCMYQCLKTNLPEATKVSTVYM